LLEQFRAPVDDEIPNFDMKANIIALRSHLVRMAESRFRTQDDQAEALGMSRSAYLDLRNKLNADVNYEE
jgi:hypothetical protein